MKNIEVKSFDKADETRPFEGHGHADYVKVGDKAVIRGTFEPGWRWSLDVKPIAGTESCQAAHLGYMLQGRMRVLMDDGTEQELTEGEVVAIRPGHDAEVVGNETVVMVDFGEIADYAQRR
jgi:hypothetical protein